MILNLFICTLCFGLYTYGPSSEQYPLEVKIQDSNLEANIMSPGMLKYTLNVDLRFNFTNEYESEFYVQLPLEYDGSVLIDSNITNLPTFLEKLHSILIQFNNINIAFDDSQSVYKPFIEFDFQVILAGIGASTFLINDHVYYVFNDQNNYFTYGRFTEFIGAYNSLMYSIDNIENSFNDGYNEGFTDGRDEAKLTNNVFGWFGEVVDSFSSFLSLQIAPGLNLGLIFSIPIITGILFFLLKALIN